MSTNPKTKNIKKHFFSAVLFILSCFSLYCGEGWWFSVNPTLELLSTCFVMLAYLAPDSKEIIIIRVVSLSMLTLFNSYVQFADWFSGSMAIAIIFFVGYILFITTIFCKNKILLIITAIVFALSILLYTLPFTGGHFHFEVLSSTLKFYALLIIWCQDNIRLLFEKSKV